MLKKRRPCVVLGIAPAGKGSPAWSPTSASGQRLADLAGIGKPAEHADFDIVASLLWSRFALDNLLPYPDPSRRALTQAAALYKFVPGFWYVLAGTEVVRALGTRALPKVPAGKLPWHGTRNAPPLEWYESREGVVMAVLPHPSGRNRWYNDRRSRAAAEKFLREARWSRGAHASWLAAAREKTG